MFHRRVVRLHIRSAILVIYIIHYYVLQSRSLLTVGLNKSMAREFKIHNENSGVNKEQIWDQLEENESFSTVEKVVSDMCSFCYENTENCFVSHIFGIQSDSNLTDCKSHKLSIILGVAMIIVRFPLIASFQFLSLNFTYRRYRIRIKKIWIGTCVQRSVKV